MLKKKKKGGRGGQAGKEEENKTSRAEESDQKEVHLTHIYYCKTSRTSVKHHQVFIVFLSWSCQLAKYAEWPFPWMESQGGIVFQLFFNTKRVLKETSQNACANSHNFTRPEKPEKSAPEWQELPRPSSSNTSMELLKWSVMFTDQCAIIWASLVLRVETEAWGLGESKLLNIIRYYTWL